MSYSHSEDLYKTKLQLILKQSNAIFNSQQRACFVLVLDRLRNSEEPSISLIVCTQTQMVYLSSDFYRNWRKQVALHLKETVMHAAGFRLHSIYIFSSHEKMGY